MKNISQDQLKPEYIRKKGRYEFQACVLPNAGGNLISFSVDGTELLNWEPERLLNDAAMTGAFNMFPTTCRLENCRYTFDDREILQTKGGEDVFIHGLIRDEILNHEVSGNRITSWVDIQEGHPVYEGFPYIVSLRKQVNLIQYN